MSEELNNKINNDYVTINTKMNLHYKVETTVIKNEINEVFKEIKNDVEILKNIEVKLNNSHTNVEISFHYKITNFENFSFLIKKIIFLIEQKTLSLINTKPININLIYEG